MVQITTSHQDPRPAKDCKMPNDEFLMTKTRYAQTPQRPRKSALGGQGSLHLNLGHSSLDIRAFQPQSPNSDCRDSLHRVSPRNSSTVRPASFVLRRQYSIVSIHCGCSASNNNCKNRVCSFPDRNGYFFLFFRREIAQNKICRNPARRADDRFRCTRLNRSDPRQKTTESMPL